MADAPDSKSGMGNSMCGFDPRLRYFEKPVKTLMETTFRVSPAIFGKVQNVAKTGQNTPKRVSSGVVNFNREYEKPPDSFIRLLF